MERWGFGRASLPDILRSSGYARLLGASLCRPGALWVAAFLLAGCATVPPEPDPPCGADPAATDSLPLYVYLDADSPQNHYALRPTFAPNDSSVWVSLASREAPVAGTCVRVEYDSSEDADDTFAHWYWEPVDPTSGQENQGYDLTHARRLVFYARGKDGGERVHFVIGGLWPLARFPDTLRIPRCAPACPVTLTTEWVRYQFDLGSLSDSLCRVVGPFSFKLVRGENPEPTVFWLDEIRYE